MDVSQIQSIILAKTYTRADYLRRISLIREYLESRFFKDNPENFTVFLGFQKASHHDHDALNLLDEHFFNLFTRENLYPVINALTESLKSLPVLTVYLAIIIDDYLVDELGVWFRKKLHPELIMEIHCNPSLVSGLAYVWNNKYHDLSLRYFFSKKEEIINKIIEDYAKNQL